MRKPSDIISQMLQVSLNPTLYAILHLLVYSCVNQNESCIKGLRLNRGLQIQFCVKRVILLPLPESAVCNGLI